MLLTQRSCAILAAALIGLGLPPAVPASAIVGGSAAAATEYPWLAAIGSPLFLTRESGQFCAGALVAPDQMVTAAHCVQLAQLLPQALTVTFGRTDLRSNDGDTVRVRDIRIHPGFHDTDFDGETVHHNNVAILTLDRPQPGPFVEIATQRADFGTILGWGATAEGDYSNTVLRAAVVPLVSDSACAAAYGSAFDPRDMLCAGSTEADTGQLDSGGPLLVDGRLVGLTSWGKGSARPGFPGVYALPHLDW
ncbi:S1 family peptidase [Nocardia sp. NPDC057440]|uniref:S1 family peptidase n=1 Tax=Nocardia sp. NPDC057440 TaxID=3346134 RepID=UPI0036720B68